MREGQRILASFLPHYHCRLYWRFVNRAAFKCPLAFGQVIQLGADSYNNHDLADSTKLLLDDSHCY
jgi:hypothetical protein